MKTESVFNVLLILIFVFMIAACSDSSDPNKTFTLSGTIVKNDVTDGIYAYMKLVNKGSGVLTSALYSATVEFNSGTAHYSVSGISEGEYTLYAFIDMNSNASGGDNVLPDAGDYVSETDVVINGDVVLSPEENDWTIY